jgi:mono/diheme cytochrome c family protein
VLAGLDRVLALVTWVAAALVVAALFAGPSLIGAEKEDAAGRAEPAPAAAPGRDVFAANCAGCHTLAAANASGAVGPNLDERKPAAAEVEAIVTAGGDSMPSFQDRLSSEQIAAVAEFVATSAGR